MKTRICIISLLVTFMLLGCQKSAKKPSGQAFAPVESSGVTSTPSGIIYQLEWEHYCDVKKAYLASRRALDDLGLGISKNNDAHVVTMGRMTSKSIPADNNSQQDAMSARINTTSALGISFQIDMNLQLTLPETTQIIIIAESSDQPEHIIREQCEILRQNICQAIQRPKVATESLPYQKTINFEQDVTKVYDSLYQWAEKMEFDCLGPQGDAFYKVLSFNTGSGIKFRLAMLNIDRNKTKLEMDVRDYEGKEELPMIHTSLKEVIAGLGGVEEVDEAEKKVAAKTEEKDPKEEKPAPKEDTKDKVDKTAAEKAEEPTLKQETNKDAEDKGDKTIANQDATDAKDEKPDDSPKPVNL